MTKDPGSDPDPVSDPDPDPDPDPDSDSDPVPDPVSATGSISAPASDPAPAPTSAPRSAPPWQRSYLIACCAIIGGAIAYWLPHWAGLPLLLYVPLQRRWTFDPPLATPAITYFGLILWGAAGTLTGGLAGALISTAAPRPLAATTLHIFGAWALTAFVLTGWYYTWNLWPF